MDRFRDRRHRDGGDGAGAEYGGGGLGAEVWALRGTYGPPGEHSGFDPNGVRHQFYISLVVLL